MVIGWSGPGILTGLLSISSTPEDDLGEAFAPRALDRAGAGNERRFSERSHPGDDQWVLPPSTLRTWPVMKEASSDAMKTIALASSSERPRRPIGTVVTSAALFSGVRVKRVNMPVSIGPGATLFTRIPDLTVSSATDLMMPSTACLLPT